MPIAPPPGGPHRGCSSEHLLDQLLGSSRARSGCHSTQLHGCHVRRSTKHEDQAYTHPSCNVHQDWRYVAIITAMWLGVTQALGKSRTSTELVKRSTSGQAVKPTGTVAGGGRARIKAVVNIGRVELEMLRTLKQHRTIEPLARFQVHKDTC